MNKLAELSDSRPKPPESYTFIVTVNGIRAPIDVAQPCGSDAEASLVAISLTTNRTGVEAWRGETLVYSAPPRSQWASWDALSSVAH